MQRPLVINIINGTTTPDLWPDQITPEVVETRSYDEWLEAAAADRGVGVVPDIARTRRNHPGIVFVPLIDAPQSRSGSASPTTYPATAQNPSSTPPASPSAHRYRNALGRP